MKLRLAQTLDLPAMMAIVSQAQAALKAAGIDQWQNGYPTPEILLQDMDRKNAYVLVDQDEIIAMMTVIFNDEPTYDRIYDGAWLTTGAFAVVHRMAVADKRKQCGIASYLIGEVERICRANHIPSLKMDTHKDNKPMRHLLEKCGLVRCGFILLRDGNPRIAYEKTIPA